MRPLQNFRILIVEDDTSLSRIIAAGLARKGAEVFVAANGIEGLESLELNHVDLIVSDVQMPEMTGLELLDRIQKKTQRLPVFLLVTGQSQITEPEAINRGATGLMQKPFKISSLAEKLEMLIETGVLKRIAA